MNDTTHTVTPDTQCSSRDARWEDYLALHPSEFDEIKWKTVPGLRERLSEGRHLPNGIIFCANLLTI